MKGPVADGLGLRQGDLRLAAPDPRWADAFAAEAGQLAAVLPVGAELHHIGSTAVAYLTAKPILDLALALPMPADEIAAALLGIGYLDRGERSGRLFVRLRGGDIRTHNLHVYPLGDRRMLAQVRFRDRLRADPALRDAYAADKAAIIARGTSRGDYAAAKTAFVTAIEL